MAVDLLSLLTRFRDIDDFEFEGRIFRTRVPAVAPKAYLTIVHRAATASIQQETIDSLDLPAAIRSFYRQYNGASLFLGSLHLYGFVRPDAPIDRSDWRKRPPHSFAEANLQYRPDVRTSPVLSVGYYGLDLSEVCVERSTGRVFCAINADTRHPRSTWPSFETWLRGEIDRLSAHFADDGTRLVGAEQSLPSKAETPH